MPTELLLHLHLDGEALPPRTVTGTTPTELAQAVHRHARGHLGSSRVDVHLDESTLTGTVTQHGALVGTFTLTPADHEETAPGPRSNEPLHGYTAADIDHLARLVVRMDRWHATDATDRVDTARYAIVEHLLTTDRPPSRRDLLRAGTDAVDAYVRDEMRTHGRCTLHIGDPMPRWHAYWNPAHTPSPEARVVDRHALTQIWPLLQPRQQQALETLAATGDYAQAAAALGVTKGTFSVLVSTARRRFLQWWHQGETPSRQWRTDRRVRSRDGRDHLGRHRLTISQVEAYRRRRQAGETLRVLAAEAGITPTTLSRLLSGKSNPAPDPVEATA